MHVCILLFTLFDFSFVDFPSVLRYCWFGLLTCKNRWPYKLYCDYLLSVPYLTVYVVISTYFRSFTFLDASVMLLAMMVLAIICCHNN